VQKPEMDVQETWMTASVPDGGTIVLSLGENTAEESGKTGKWTIVLVKPVVILAMQTGSRADVQSLTAEDIGMYMPEMAKELERKREHSQNLKKLRATGKGETHPDVVTAKAELKDVQKEIDQLAERFKRLV